MPLLATWIYRLRHVNTREKLQVEGKVKTLTSVRKEKSDGRESVSHEKHEGGGTPGLDPSGRV